MGAGELGNPQVLRKRGAAVTFSFRPAKRSEAKPLIGLYAESGAGKTLSALLLARGFVGPTGKVGMIETESGRGEAYADDPRVPGGYAVLSLREDFSPGAFGEALAAAEKADLDALIIDSASHEWEAVGGVLHMAAKNEAAGKKGPLVWQQPKMDHSRHFILPLLGTPIPLVIVCMRARYPMQQKGKEWARAETLVPYQSDTILFELFAHGWIDREHRFHGTKWTRDELRTVLRDNEPITLETGQRLAAWAKGGTDRGATVPPTPGSASVAVGDQVQPSPTEIMANDFAERWDEVKTIQQGIDLRNTWEAALQAHPFTRAELEHVEAAATRARQRVKGR